MFKFANYTELYVRKRRQWWECQKLAASISKKYVSGSYLDCPEKVLKEGKKVNT